MMRGTSGAVSAPAAGTAFIVPASPPAPIAEQLIQNVATVDKATGTASMNSLQRGVGLAAVVACGAGATTAGRRRRQRGSQRVALRAFENELGVQAPVGFFDPMGFTKDGDVEDFRQYREAELKHGRVSMFAAMGYITPEYFKLPGYLSPSNSLKFADVPNGLAAVSKVPEAGWLQWVALCGFYELCVNVPKDSAEPGNYGRGQLGFTGKSIEDPEKRKRSLNSELANGRLAMVAITGMIFQNGFIGSTGPEMWIPGGAADRDLGMASSSVALQARRECPEVLAGTGGPNPKDFWDPAGITRGKSDKELLELRAIELKHGRVAMLAVLGWFHVAAGWHPIGDAAAGTRVSDNPLVNLTELPIGGAFQVVFTIMCFEWLLTYIIKPPENKPWDVLGWTPVIADENWPEWKDKQLQELNNGRLAMFAIVGLIAGDAYSGEYAAGISKLCWTGTCPVFQPLPGVAGTWI